VQEAHALVLEHLQGRRCVGYGKGDPVVLEFDHVGEKRSEISTLVQHGVRPAVLLEELGRCDVVCANCHRLRTAVAAGHYRGRSGEVPPARVELALRD
jgi:hypothetical protein